MTPGGARVQCVPAYGAIERDRFNVVKEWIQVDDDVVVNRVPGGQKQGEVLQWRGAPCPRSGQLRDGISDIARLI